MIASFGSFFWGLGKYFWWKTFAFVGVFHQQTLSVGEKHQHWHGIIVSFGLFFLRIREALLVENTNNG